MEKDNEFALLEKMLESIIVVDKENRIREVNQATVSLLGYKKNELTGMSINRICENLSLKDLRNKVPIKEEELIYKDKKKNKVCVSVNIMKRIQYPDDIVLVARDISGIKSFIEEINMAKKEAERAYEDIKSSKETLIHSEKLAYTGRMAVNIAHEIRNPLTNVYMTVQQIKKLLKKENHSSKYIDTIEGNIDRINFLITELLNCARPPKLNLNSNDIHKILENTLEATRPKWTQQKIEVVRKFENRVPRVTVDRELIGRVFSNLIVNAIEAMPKGGTLSVITKLNEGSVMVKIQDTGKGIPEGDVFRIFDPFFSSKPEGMGLGLNLCYGIIVSHGGTIEVESKHRKGSIFTVSLPVIESGM